MSDDPIGTCCAIAFIACLDVCSGICFDYASFRTSSFKFRFSLLGLWYDANL
jgi:hypothetical protein